MDGYAEKPIRDIHIEKFHVVDAPYSHYLYSTQRVNFKEATVNGKPLPEHPEPQAERQTLDVY